MLIKFQRSKFSVSPTLAAGHLLVNIGARFQKSNSLRFSDGPNVQRRKFALILGENGQILRAPR
jgi:hypothetical protein